MLVDLARETLADPRGAARRILALRLDGSTLLQAAALIVALNAAVFGLSNMTAPPPPNMALPAMVTSPLAFALVLGGGLLLTVWALTQVGRMLGGQGGFADLLALLVWLQSLRLAVQVALLVLVPLLPAIAGIVVLVASVWGLWILLCFVDEAHGFGSLPRAAGTTVLAFVAMALGLSFLLALFGGATSGM